MAHFVGNLNCKATAEAVFDCMSDFSNAADWDPTVTRVATDGSGGIGLGARFEVFLGTALQEVGLRYEITQFEPNRYILFEAHSDFIRSRDTIKIETTKTGCNLDYDADLRLLGPAALLDLPVHLAFQLSGRRSLGGLEKALDDLG